MEHPSIGNKCSAKEVVATVCKKVAAKAWQCMQCGKFVYSASTRQRHQKTHQGGDSDESEAGGAAAGAAVELADEDGLVGPAQVLDLEGSEAAWEGIGGDDLHSAPVLIMMALHHRDMKQEQVAWRGQAFMMHQHLEEADGEAGEGPADEYAAVHAAIGCSAQGNGADGAPAQGHDAGAGEGGGAGLHDAAHALVLLQDILQEINVGPGPTNSSEAIRIDASKVCCFSCSFPKVREL
jgi:hypothetical protein